MRVKRALRETAGKAAMRKEPDGPFASEPIEKAADPDRGAALEQ